MATGGLAEEESGDAREGDASDASPTRLPLGLTLGGGVDFPTAYYFRGFLQQDEGFIAQPFLTLSAPPIEAGGFTTVPYVGWWNSLGDTATTGARGGHGGGPQVFRFTHTHPDGVTETHEFIVPGDDSGDGKPWYEADLMAGATITRGDLTLDVQYHAHFFPDGVHDSVQELGARISYDVVGLLEERPTDPNTRPFSVRPFAAVFREIADDNGSEETYLEGGVEPIWRFKSRGQPVALSAPLALAGSPDGYYTHDDGSNASLGYFSASIRASIALPVRSTWGNWYLNAAVTYLYLIADDAVFFNDGERNEVIGSVGVGVSY